MFDTLIAGLLRGNVYALGAVGISLVFGVMNVVNFAQFSFDAVGKPFNLKEHLLS